MTKKTALLAVANGSEETEAVATMDTLVRGGVQVTMASVERTLQVTASRGVRLVADVLIDDASLQERLFDAVVLPGGMPGAEHLRDSTELLSILKRHAAAKRIIGAICAAPAVALAAHGLMDRVHATCFPSPAFRGKLQSHPRIDEPVVVDGHFITSQGPGTALAFGLALVQALCGTAQAEQVAKGLLVSMPTVGAYTQ